MVLAVFAVLWVAVLFPILLRKRAERVVGVSVDTFRHQLRVLRRSGKAKIRPANRLHGPAFGPIEVPVLVPAETAIRPSVTEAVNEDYDSYPTSMGASMAASWAAVPAQAHDAYSFETDGEPAGTSAGVAPRREGNPQDRERIVSIRAQRLREQRRQAARIRAQRRQAAVFAAVGLGGTVCILIGLASGLHLLLAAGLCAVAGTALYVRSLHRTYRNHSVASRPSSEVRFLYDRAPQAYSSMPEDYHQDRAQAAR